MIDNLENIEQANFFEIYCICLAKIFGKAEYNIALGGGGIVISDDMKEYMQKNSMEKYGTKIPMQSDIVKDKLKTTCLEKYGVDCVFKNENIKDKIKKTIISKYGVESPTQNEYILNKIKKTCLKKYGVDNIFKKENYIKDIFMEKFGVDNPSKLDEVKRKKAETCLKNHGETSHMKTDKYKEYFSKHQKEYKESIITIGFYDYCKEVNKNDFLTGKLVFDEDFDTEVTFVSCKEKNISKKIGKKFVNDFLSKNEGWINHKINYIEIDENITKQIISLRDENFNFSEIARKLNISDKRVKETLLQNNYTRNIKLKVLNESEKEKIIELRKTMGCIRDLAMKAHLKYAVVKEFLESIEPPKIEKYYNYDLIKELYKSGKTLYNICCSQNIGRSKLKNFLKKEGLLNE